MDNYKCNAMKVKATTWRQKLCVENVSILKIKDILPGVTKYMYVDLLKMDANDEHSRVLSLQILESSATSSLKCKQIIINVEGQQALSLPFRTSFTLFSYFPLWERNSK